MGEHDPLTNLITRLERIAKLNKVHFKYAVQIVPQRHGMLYYNFECAEKFDSQIFVDGVGATLQDACATAGEEIDDACEGWHYRNPGDK